uniref:Uncharacterized protein n=1 Tax=Setaria italica TaxID=4555 RepID=K3XTV6_SETIT
MDGRTPCPWMIRKRNLVPIWISSHLGGQGLERGQGA